jgi:small subunit ribosomal protein S20|uniref:ribosomal protein S20 n=1 Tax=Ditylum brightwellii TaxID=49249 RepID=UPI0022376718|nr:ribosomal protein S20 [Ditylum brightwellii]UYC30821.1 ribosomal protein S20 [Ditylum brightwellii]|mmetsp:Transcript_12004/g.17603  ORF Transcript_12004/g.17603 Transcript_12004/m.17603 type:complete len:97 (-) Transcript_12004:67-357(-)
MANSKSAEKRISIAKRNQRQNRFYKSSVRTLTKLYLKNVELFKTSQNPSDREKAQSLLNSVYSLLDKGKKRNVFHKNTVARKKMKLAAQLKTIDNN